MKLPAGLLVLPYQLWLGEVRSLPCWVVAGAVPERGGGTGAQPESSFLCCGGYGAELVLLPMRLLVGVA